MEKQFEAAVTAAVPTEGAARRLRDSIVAVFNGVPLEGVDLLDVGGGAGLHSFYAALNGAHEVVCLEPGGSGALAEYGRSAPLQGVGGHDATLQFFPMTLQEFDAKNRKFDVILLNNSVNHLDEQACMKLPSDTVSIESYGSLFEKLAALSNDGATIIITDCSSKNFFGILGVKSPFAPTIEWEKHQQATVWTGFLHNAGFTDVKIQWLVPQRLGPLGQSLLGHRVGCFFLSSYFRLTARKADGLNRA